MVVFTCNYCGESVHKPKVEKHFQFACRSKKSLTCVDCFKDFFGEEYVGHTKCLTEDERYAAKGTYKAAVPKGELKQESWMEIIKSIIENEQTNLSAELNGLLHTISGYSNVPRKKAKFLNFVSNSVGRRTSPVLLEEAWQIIEQYKNKKDGDLTTKNGNLITQVEADDLNEENTLKTNEADKVTNKKRKTENGDSYEIKKPKIHDSIEQCNETPESIEQSTENLEFSFESQILAILKKKQEISLAKLQRKVLRAYIKEKNLSEASKKVEKKFNKKLTRMSQVEIKDNLVVLL